MVWTRQSRSLCLYYDKGNGTILDTYLNRTQNLSGPTNGISKIQRSNLLKNCGRCQTLRSKLAHLPHHKLLSYKIRVFLMQRKCTQTACKLVFQMVGASASLELVSYTQQKQGEGCGVWVAPMQIFCLRMHGPRP